MLAKHEGVKEGKKRIVVIAVACACALGTLGVVNHEAIYHAFGAGAPAQVEVVKLTNAQMEDSLKEIARRLENSMRETDANARVEFKVNEDGSCEFVGSGTDDSGVFHDGEIINSGKSVKQFFELYYENGFFDADGNVQGFPDEVPEEELASSGSSAASLGGNPAAASINQNDGYTAQGFPGQGSFTTSTVASSAPVASNAQ